MAELTEMLRCPKHGVTIHDLSIHGLSRQELRDLTALPQHRAAYECRRCLEADSPECDVCRAEGERSILVPEAGIFGTRWRCLVCEKHCEGERAAKNLRSRRRWSRFYGFVGGAVVWGTWAVVSALVFAALALCLYATSSVWDAWSEWSTPRRGHYHEWVADEIERKR